MDVETYYTWFEAQGFPREQIKKAKAKYDNLKKIKEDIKFNLVCRDLGIEMPPDVKKFIKKETEVDKNMGKAVEIDVPKAVDLSPEQKIEAKMDGYSAQLGMLIGTVQQSNVYLKAMAEDISIWKNVESRLVSLLETLLARTDAVSKGVAQIMPAPVPANIIPQPTVIQGQAPVAIEATGATIALPIPQAVMPVPAATMAIPQAVPPATFTKAERLPLDGSAERGTAPAKYSFYACIITPSEFTKAEDGSIKSVKCSFQYNDPETGMLRSSWNEKYENAEVFLAKSLISQNSIIKRVQVQQQVEVANWYLKKNSR